MGYPTFERARNKAAAAVRAGRQVTSALSTRRVSPFMKRRSIADACAERIGSVGTCSSACIPTAHSTCGAENMKSEIGLLGQFSGSLRRNSAAVAVGMSPMTAATIQVADATGAVQLNPIVYAGSDVTKMSPTRADIVTAMPTCMTNSMVASRGRAAGGRKSEEGTSTHSRISVPTAIAVLLMSLCASQELASLLNGGLDFEALHTTCPVPTHLWWNRPSARSAMCTRSPVAIKVSNHCLGAHPREAAHAQLRDASGEYKVHGNPEASGVCQVIRKAQCPDVIQNWIFSMAANRQMLSAETANIAKMFACGE